MRLFDENGKGMSIYDICKWWVETYPDDVFFGDHDPLVRARVAMKEILAMKKEIR